MKLTFCVACGRDHDLNHHHLVPRAVGGSDDETNLITLCRECHGKAHSVEWALGHTELVKIGHAKAKEKRDKRAEARDRRFAERAMRFKIMEERRLAEQAERDALESLRREAFEAVSAHLMADEAAIARRLKCRPIV